MQRLATTLAVALASCWATAAFGSNVVADVSRRWPVRTVEVVICDDAVGVDVRYEACAPQAAKARQRRRSARLNDHEAWLIRSTIDRWNAEFAQNITFREVSAPRGSSTIVFRRSSRPTRCSTEGIGFSSAQRWKHISVGSRCGPGGETSTSEGTVAHEMLHAVGVYHEQQRPDRGRMLRIGGTGRKAHQWKSACRPGASCKDTVSARPVGRYDFGSLMHYSLDVADAKLTRAGKRRLKAQRLKRSKVGQRKWLSSADKQGLRKLYPAG